MGYGYTIVLRRDYFGVMLNGRMFNFSRGHLSGRWAFNRWDKMIWRKTQTRMP